MQTRKELSIKWDSIDLNINGTLRNYPLLRINLTGKLGIGDILKLMDKISKATDDFEEEYISLTDFTNLNAGLILQSLFAVSMDWPIKTLLRVRNKSLISFVLLGEDSDMKILKNKLVDMNEKRDPKDYSYNYVFIENTDQLKEIAEDVLSKR